MGQVTKDRIALVGLQKSTCHLAPFDDPSWEIWTVNEAFSPQFSGLIKRTDRHFQVHQRDVWDRPNNWVDSDHPKWLREKHPFPVYMLESYPDVPSAVCYPMEDILHDLNADPYFGSSVPYMLAMAIWMKPKVIGLWGIEHRTGTSYEMGRDSILYWIGFARSRGIEVMFHDGCSLSSDGRPLYGVDGVIAGISRDELRARLEQNEDSEKNAVAALELSAPETWYRNYAMLNYQHGAVLLDRRLLELCGEMDILTRVFIERERAENDAEVMVRQARFNYHLGVKAGSGHPWDEETHRLMAEVNGYLGVTGECLSIIARLDGGSSDGNLRELVLPMTEAGVQEALKKRKAV